MQSSIVECAVCGSSELIRKVGDKKFKIGPKRQSVMVKIAWDLCQNCGAEYLDKAARGAILAARNAAHTLLTASQLLSIRQRLGMTQQAWSDKLGIGDKSYTRWESGKSIQSKSMDNLIRRTAADLGIPDFLTDVSAEWNYSDVHKKFIHITKQAFEAFNQLKGQVPVGVFPFQMVATPHH